MNSQTIQLVLFVITVSALGFLFIFLSDLSFKNKSNREIKRMLDDRSRRINAILKDQMVLREKQKSK